MTARVLLWLALVGLALVDGAPKLCEPGPNWTLEDGIVPMDYSLGKVTVIGLLKASTTSGLEFASKLQNLYLDFKTSKNSDVDFMVINDVQDGRFFNKLYTVVAFSVFQDESYLKIWEQLEGSNNELFVYDQEGRLRAHLRPSLSYPDDLIIRQSIIEAFEKNGCSPSRLKSDSLSNEEDPPNHENKVNENAPAPNIGDIGYLTDIETIEKDGIISSTTESSPSSTVDSKPFSLWNFFKSFFWGGETIQNVPSTVASTTIETTTTAPPETSTEGQCDRKYINTCKKYSKRYVRQAQRCCHFKIGNNEDCGEFSERKCERMDKVITCCLEHTLKEQHNVKPSIQPEYRSSNGM